MIEKLNLTIPHAAENAAEQQRVLIENFYVVQKSINDLAIQKESVSTGQAIGVNFSFIHQLGSLPKTILAVLVCQIAELNYTVGKHVPINLSGNDPAGTNNRGLAISYDETTIDVTYGSDATSPISILDLSTGNASPITLANWTLIIKALA